MKKDIIKTLRYFAFFSYAPSLEEIYLFLPQRASRGSLEGKLNQMQKEGSIAREKLFRNRHGDSLYRYTLVEYSIKFKGQRSKVKISQKKIQKIQLYIKLLSFFPQIQLIGLSGSVAMRSAEKGDDIDIFIITKSDRLWTGRFIAVIIAQLIGMRRTRQKFHRGGGTFGVKDKICLNLFFDEKNLCVSKKKQNQYVAHEILQMKPLYVRDDVYPRFLKANSWVFKLFPNVRSSMPFFDSQRSPTASGIPAHKKGHLRFPGNLCEYFLKKLQLVLINRHRTTELITATQLWFFPDDFEKKLNKK